MKTQIGTYTVPQDEVVTEHYQYAADYRRITIPAGDYPVYTNGYYVFVAIPGVIESEDFGSYYGGVRLTGSAYPTNGAQGQSYTHHIQAYAYGVARDILENPGTTRWTLVAGYGAAWKPFEYKDELIVTTAIVNPEGVELHGYPSAPTI